MSLSIILCCKCGASMVSNPTNMCEVCLSSESDITADIGKQHTVTFCPKCSRFLNPPSQWIPAELESPELLSLCLKRVKGLGKGNKLKEASFIFTEPHSRRLIIQIVVRGELGANTVVEQKAVLNFTMHPQQCTDCTRHAAKDYWNACLQIRQKVEHKRTLHHLEQILLSKKVPKQYSSVKQVKGGIDFYFSTRSKAVLFMEYVMKIVPCRAQTSQQLKSHDVHNNTFNYKFTFCLEVAPVCKHDIVCLSKAFANRIGFNNQLLIVSKITDKIRLLDPISCLIREVDVASYFANPFFPVSNPRHSTEFFVMDLENSDNDDVQSSTNTSMLSLSMRDAGSKLKPVGVWVVPTCHLGSGTEDGDNVFTRSHLGHILKVGDSVMGMDFRNANINNTDFDLIPDEKRPDVILIQRHTPSSGVPKYRKRKFNTDSMATSTAATSDKDVNDSDNDSDYDDMEDENYNQEDNDEEEFFDAVSDDHPFGWNEMETDK